MQGPTGELQPAMVMAVVVVIAPAFLAFAIKPIADRLKLAQLELCSPRVA